MVQYFFELSRMNTTQPLIKWGWLRALICFIAVLAIGFGMRYLNEPVNEFVKQQIDKSLVEFVASFITYTATGAVIVFITWLCIKFIDRQTFKSMGFAINGYANEAGMGLFTPLFLLSAGTLFLIATGNLSITGINFQPTELLLQLGFMLVVAFTEEIFTRGYLLNNMLQSMNKWLALLISALVFALFHLANPDVTWVALVNILLAGLLLGLNYVYTQNLWYSIVFHFSWNFFQGAVLGYDVSGFKLPGIFSQSLNGSSFITGGSFGFEGSFDCTVLLLITIMLFYVGFERKYKAL